MIFVEDHWESYEDPKLELHLLHDDAGTPFLLLTGPEPDLQWERFTSAVIAVVEPARRTPDRRPELDPDGGAAHPTDRRHRARHPAAS